MWWSYPIVTEWSTLLHHMHLYYLWNNSFTHHKTKISQYTINIWHHISLITNSFICIVQRIGNIDLRKKLEDDESLSEDLIDQILNTFLQQVKDGSWENGGWPQVFTDYSLSKLAVNAYTRLTARIFSELPEGRKIYVNCYCPGWVKTAMTGWAGHTSPEEGADTAVWLALLQDQSINGKFFAERREINF